MKLGAYFYLRENDEIHNNYIINVDIYTRKI